MKLKKLQFKFPNEQTALIDSGPLEFNWNGFASLCAPSGSGKSTLFRLITGWFTDLERNGHALCTGDFDRFASVRFVGGHKGLLSWKRVSGNIHFQNGQLDEALIRASLPRLGFDAGVLGMYPYQLSMGMYKRIELLLAVAARPKLLLLDEFFSSIGDDNKKSVRDFILKTLPDATVWVTAHEESMLQWIGGPRFTFRVNNGTIYGLDRK